MTFYAKKSKFCMKVLKNLRSCRKNFACFMNLLLIDPSNVCYILQTVCLNVCLQHAGFFAMSTTAGGINFFEHAIAAFHVKNLNFLDELFSIF